MQLTGGQYKNTKLTTPSGARPTLSVVREGIFNILFSYFDEFEDKKFLDGFSGSGIMALEAHSRGFKVLAIEKNGKIFKETRENFKKLKIENSILLYDFEKFIKSTKETFNIIYLDPPWDMNYEKFIELSLKKLENNGLLIIESDNKNKIDFSTFENKNIEIIKDKNYGRCRITILRAIFS